MWFITLLVLAVAAVLIIKAVKAHSERLSNTVDDQAPTAGLQGSLSRPGLVGDAKQSSPVSGMQEDSAPRHTPPEASSSGSHAEHASSSSTLHDIREMMKTLNLTDSDSPRLGISRDEFNALRNHEKSESSTLPLPDPNTQADVAERLRRMLN